MNNDNYNGYDTPIEQAIQFLQGGAGLGVSTGVLHGARGAARDGARRNARGDWRVVWNDLLIPFTVPNYLLPDTNYSYRAKKRFGNS